MWRGSQFQANPTKKDSERPSQWKNLGLMACACHPNRERKCKIR
jgi:hypothetical protein